MGAPVSEDPLAGGTGLTPRLAAGTLLLLLLILLCGLARPSGAAAQQPRRAGPPAPERPHLVLFLADDLGAGDIAPYGSPVARTPALTRLAAESLRFTRAFAPSPTCSPSRSSIYTGLMPFRNGAHANHSGVHPGTRSIVHHLADLGYRVALAGKLHVGPAEAFPFELIAGTNAPEPGFEQSPGLRHDLVLEPVERWLESLPDDQPFALVVGEHSPHVVWPDVPEYDPADVDVPASHIDTPELRRARARYFTDVEKMDRNLGTLLEILERRGLAGATLLIFTSDQGPQWPFAKWNVYDAGVRAPLLVRWPGRVRAGATTDALVSLVDLLPTMIEAAGGVAPPALDGRSFLDVALGRTAAHRESVFATHTGDGRMNRSPARMIRTARYKYILNLNPDSLHTTHMDRVGREGYWESWRAASFRDEHAAAVLWRYHHRPAEELYDLEADPDERINLAAVPAHRARLEELRDRLARWRARQGDAETGPEDLSARAEQRGVAPYVF